PVANGARSSYLVQCRGLLRIALSGPGCDAEETSLDPPEQIPQLVLRVLPALLASVYSAASAVFGNIPHTRRLALLDSLGERPRAAPGRYLSQTGVIEARWLVVRLLGVAGSSVLLYPLAPAPQGFWTVVLVLLAFVLPSQLLIALSSRLAAHSLPSLLGFLRPLELLAAPI